MAFEDAFGPDAGRTAGNFLSALGAGILSGNRYQLLGPGFQTELARQEKATDVRRQREGLKLVLKQANPSLSDDQLEAMASDPATAKLGLQALEMQASQRAGQQAGSIMNSIIGGSPAPAPTSNFGMGTATPAKHSLTGPIGQQASAIQAVESSGNYGAIGPATKSGDRAFGAYQVMGANIPSWTKEALGREMTPQEFVSDPKAQDQVFAHRFGGYVQRFGNTDDASSMWFTGKPLAQGANRRDQLGTSGSQYVDRFNRALAGLGGEAGGVPTGQPGAAPVQVADASGQIGGLPRAVAGVSPAREPVQVAENEADVQRLEREMGMVPGAMPPQRQVAASNPPAPIQGGSPQRPNPYDPNRFPEGSRTRQMLDARAQRVADARAGAPVQADPQVFALSDPVQAQRAIPQLMQVLTIPNLPEAQREQAKTMLSMAMKAVEPTDMRRKLVEAGYRPGTPEFRDAYRNLLNGDRTPMGYRMRPDGAGLEPIPGGPADPANSDASKAPSGFQVGPDGRTLQIITGGPADPNVIRQQSEARQDAKPVPPPKPLPHNAVKDLGEAGGSYGEFNRLVGGFQDGFAGWRSNFVGDTANTIARQTGIGNTAAADWWSDYAAKRNVTRNKLFGSALTAQEKSEFEKADIAPGMTPETIRKNLDRQQAAATEAARKMAGYYVKSGRDPAEIEAAIGVPLDMLGLTPNGSRADAGQGAPSQGAPKADPSARFKALIGGGLSKEQAYQKMQAEGF